MPVSSMVSIALAALLLVSCSGTQGPLAGCGDWVIDDQLANSSLVDFEFANEDRTESRDELELTVIEFVTRSHDLANLEVVVGDAEEVEAALLPDFTRATVGSDKPFPTKPDWLVLGSGEQRWAVVLHDDALGSAPLAARLDEGWYILGDVHAATCG